MGRCLLVLALLFISVGNFAQGIRAGVASLSFSDASELDSLQLSLFLINPYDVPVVIEEIRLYDTFGMEGFSVSDDSLTLPANGFQKIDVFFHPGQNVFHNSELVAITKNGLGAIAVDLQGQGTFSLSYYSTTQNLSQQALKNALKSRISSGQQSLSYNIGRDRMFMDVDNKRFNGEGASTNTLECVYTGSLVTGYSNRSAAQNMGFNTEHTYPQSFFAQGLPMRSDIHHLFPTTATSNSQRSNLPFGLVSNPSWQQGGSKMGGGVFEPRDKHKGNVARAMLYFVTRYQNYSNFLNSQEAILRQWHEQFPPTSIDSQRNEAIFSFQGNRNPFVDYPQLANRISSISSTSNENLIQIDQPYSSISFPDQSVSDTNRFSYVIMNNGRLPVTISNVQTTSSIFTLNQPDTTLEAGEDLTMLIQFAHDQPGMYEGAISFDTNVPGQTSQSIPVRGELLPATKLSLKETTFALIPREGQQIYELRLGERVLPIQSVDIKLLDMQGKEVRFLATQTGESEFILDLSSLANGHYVLSLKGIGAKMIRKSDQ
ncbi:MAG: endonuclease [Bacteroidota bacterium]